MVKRCSLYSLLWLLVLLFSAGTHAAQEKPPGLTVVLLSAYDLHTTKNRFAPFRHFLSEQLQQKIFVHSATRFEKVETWAQRGQADIIFMGAHRGREMVENYNYQLLAQNFQPVNLYVPRGQLMAPLTRFKHIGVIRNTTAREVALKTMPSLSPDVHFTDFPHHTAALLALIENKVDALVTSHSAVQGVFENIAQRIGARYSFGNVGSVVVVIAPQLAATPTADTIRQLLLNNEGVVRKVFQDNFGLGPFLPPTNSHDSLVETSVSERGTAGNY